MVMTILLIGFGGMAVIGLIFWDRLGRLEHEVKQLKIQLQEVPASAAETSAGVLASPPPDDVVSAPLEPAAGDDMAVEAAVPEESPAVEQAASFFALKTTEETSPVPDTEPGPDAPDQTLPAPAPDPAPTREARRRGFEQFFGARLAVWGGGIALAMAGFFLVKYSIEIGLITPPVRMVLGGLFGLALLAGAEIVHRRPDIANGARISQSLAGAGIAVLYAVVYITTSIYALIPSTLGFLGLAGITAAALMLSLRRGPPIAVMGLVGGFATPAMVSTSTPNVPVLLVYLLLVIGGLLLLIRRQGWWWLAIPAALGGFGWAGLILTSDIGVENSLWLGLFLLAMTAMVFVTSDGDRGISVAQAMRSARTLMPILTGGVALAQLAVVVGAGGFAWRDWGLFGLLAAGCIVLGARRQHCLPLPPLALITALTLLALSPAPDTVRFWIAAAGTTALFAGAGYWLTWRSEQAYHWLGLATATTLGAFTIAYVRMYPADADAATDLAWAALALGLAVPAALSAMIAQSRRDAAGGTADNLLLIAAGTVAAMVAGALMLAVPAEFLPTAFAIEAVVVILTANRLQADRLNWIAGATGAFFAGALATVPDGTVIEAMVRMVTVHWGDGSAWITALPILPLAAAAWLTSWRRQRLAFAWAATITATMTLTLVVPLKLLPFAMAAEGLVLMLLARRFGQFGLRGQAFTAVAISGWQSLLAVTPLATAAIPSLVGQPVFGTDLPALSDIALMVALPAIPLAGMAWVCPAREGRNTGRAVLFATAGLWAIILGYAALKSLFGIDAPKTFQQIGFLERAVITHALFALGAAAFWARDRFGREALAWSGLALTGMAVGRLVWFDLAVFNPMLVPQSVGGWPLLNALLLTYGLPIAWLAALQRRSTALPGLRNLDVAAKALCLGLILILALAQMRHLFHGDPMILGPVGTAELYAYSAAALAVAIGFLVWGVARGDQMIRLASLGLMLAAIAKVFLYDASALTGLWRIAAFTGLGLSLLGISWLYGRYVFTGRGDTSSTAEPEDAAEMAR